MDSKDSDGSALADKLAVVVGASEGIGRAVAVAMAHAGARVVLAGRSLERLNNARSDFDVRGDVDAVELDVAIPDSITAAAAVIESRHGAPAILFNSAGYSITKPALEVTVADWDAVHDVQLRGTFFSCQAFARPMVTASYGKIINVSSTWAVTVAPGRSVYSIAKAGVSQLTAALGTEWAPLGVRVNAIGPTATVTPAIEARLAADPSREEYLRSRIPMGRLATVNDMIGAALFLAGPASDFVTGQTLFVDGGWVGSK
jgi:NAD(P)-dependent dehydrogenase (short-subunit alcohol dehydrogenase family)